MKHRIKQKLISTLIQWWATAANWVGNICYSDLNHPIGWRDHLRWFLEARLDPIFTFLYSGSDEEIDDALNGNTPFEYLNERQIAAVYRSAYVGCEPDFSLLALPAPYSCPFVSIRG